MRVDTDMFKKGINTLKSDSGAVTIEAAGVFVCMIMLIFFVFDLSKLILNKGKVERVSHSIASIVRERTYLYNSQNLLTRQDVEDMADVAKRLLGDTFPGKNVAIQIETLYFDNGNKNSATIDDSMSVSYSTLFSSVSSCKAAGNTLKNAPELKNMTFWSERSSWGWVPVYRVTVCVERDDFSGFSRFVGQIINMPASITISNVVMPR